MEHKVAQLSKKCSEKPRLLFFVTEDWYFAMHFLHFAEAAKSNGWHVALVCNTGQKGSAALEQIQAAEIDVFPIKFGRSSLSPLDITVSLIQFLRFCRNWKPDLIHAIALKPIIYSFLTSLYSKIPVLNMMTGLGFVFTSSSMKAKFIKPLINPILRLILGNRNGKLIVLNKEDADWAKSNFRISPDQIIILPGVGIDTERFHPGNQKNQAFTLAYVGRMLKDKGLMELIESVKILRQQGINFKLRLAGAPDPSNPESLSESIIKEWHNCGLCEYVGHIAKVPEFLREADAMVLPSYREGMPTCILEAASTGIPCVATDVPGCREAVIDNLTGLLVPKQNSVALAEAIAKLANEPKLRAQMGKNAREMVLNKYSKTLITNKILEIYGKCYSRLGL